jgi:hypothetical protein
LKLEEAYDALEEKSDELETLRRTLDKEIQKRKNVEDAQLESLVKEVAHNRSANRIMDQLEQLKELKAKEAAILKDFKEKLGISNLE